MILSSSLLWWLTVTLLLFLECFLPHVTVLMQPLTIPTISFSSPTSATYTHIFINSSIIPGVTETTCRFTKLWSLIYQHEEGRRVSDSANRVAEKVGEEGDLAAGPHLTPPLYIFDARTVLDWVELSDHHCTTDPVIHNHIDQ